MAAPRFFCALLAIALLLPLAGHAQTAREMRKQVEGSMLVTGSVDIARDGSVTAHVLNQADKLPPYVVSLIARAVPALRFEPVLVDGAPVLARAAMSLRLVATPGDDGNMQVGIKSVHFGEEHAPDDPGGVRSIDMTPPRFPMSIAEIGGKGTVYLLVKVGRDGSVEEAVSEQTNLTALGNAREMESIRRGLEKAAISAAQRWTFAPPTRGDGVDNPYWVVRVPVDFRLSSGTDLDDRYGEWVGYVPGARHRPAWAEPDPPGFSPDTLVAGGVHQGRSRFRLLTPLEG
ncbi:MULTISPECIES: energy transducer TonB [Luteimonas]|uniref:energy transducer TonB n=1 Tax=Luteimonas TaxID=83614 RepID=UPI000C7C80CE|nr:MULTISPECIES: energy transducer TonB [Luteimonas]